MVGGAIVRALRNQQAGELLLRPRTQLDLTQQSAVFDFFEAERPSEIYLAAARVGGILANSRYPADFIYSNLMVQTNVIHASFVSGAKRLLFLGSSCIYPKLASQPIGEDALLTGPLEPTNEPYAIAKIAGVKMCESYNRQHGTDFRTVMPTNLYGTGDNYDPEDSHVVPGLIRRFHDAKQAGLSTVTVWGTGRARREFLHVDDLARACLVVMALPREAYLAATGQTQGHINVGSGIDVSIAELAETVARVVGYSGRIEFDTSRPDGTPRKWLDSSRIRALGWQPEIDLRQGLEMTYEAFRREPARLGHRG